MANISVALIRTFPSLTYLPFAFIEHIFRIVCLANLISDQPFLSSSGVSLPSNEDQISSVTFRSFWVDSKIRSHFTVLRFLSVHVPAKISPALFSLSLLFSPSFVFFFFSMALFQRIYARSLDTSVYTYIHTYILYACIYRKYIFIYICF